MTQTNAPNLREPGQKLASSEELLPGPGTYDDGTDVRAAVFGEEAVDPETMAIGLRAAGRSIQRIERGDVVVGVINFLKPAMASVQILAVRGKEGRTILQQIEGTLHVSKIDSRYIEDVSDEYRVGDVIRAKVLSLKGGPQLATDRPEFGVVRADCPDDGTRLEVSGKRLACPDCGLSVIRKIATDYGSGEI